MTWHEPDAVRLELGLPVPAALRLIANNGPAATVAACLTLKTLFLALHLLALNPPRSSGLERLALLHWSFDVWNVWCLVEFVRRGRLPWGLETCVLYHVVGYVVYTLVYLYLQNREWAERGELSRMAATPDSEVTVRISEAEEEDEEGPAATREPFATPGRDGVISEDVPDEESAAEDREDRQKPAIEDNNNRQPAASGRDALCAIPEDAPLPQPGSGVTDSAPQDQSESQDQPQDQSPHDGKETSEAPREDSSPERGQPNASPADGKPSRKPDAAGELLRPSPTAMDGGRRMDITQDVAAALKADRDVAAILNAGQDLIMAAMHAADQRNEAPKPGGEEPKPPPPELGGTEERPEQSDDQAARQDGAEDGRGDQSGGQNGVNGGQNGVHNGAHNGAQNGDHNGNGDQNGASEKDRGEEQNRDHGETRDGE